MFAQFFKPYPHRLHSMFALQNQYLNCELCFIIKKGINCFNLFYFLKLMIVSKEHFKKIKWGSLKQVPTNICMEIWGLMGQDKRCQFFFKFSELYILCQTCSKVTFTQNSIVSKKFDNFAKRILRVTEDTYFYLSRLVYATIISNKR